MKTIQKIIATGILGLGLTGLAGCCEQFPHTGTIYSKFYEPEKVTKSTMTIPMGKSYTTIPIRNVDDEDYVLMIESFNDKHKRKETRYEVEKSVYDKFDLGDTYPPLEKIEGEKITK